MSTKRARNETEKEKETDNFFSSPLDLSAGELKEYMQAGKFDLQKLFDKFGTLFVAEAYERLALQKLLFEQLRLFYTNPGNYPQDPNTYHQVKLPVFRTW